MRAVPLTWYRLRWPREVEPQQVERAFRLLAATGGRPIVVETIGTAGHVEHRLALVASRAGSVVNQLQAVVPALSIETMTTRPHITLSRAATLHLSTRRRSLRTDDLATVSRALLTALAHVGRNESLLLQWVLASSLSPLAVPNRLDAGNRESWLSSLLLAPFTAPRPMEAEARTALRQKQAEPGWQAIGRIGVQAGSPSRQGQLLRQLAEALRSAEAAGVRLFVRSTSTGNVLRASVGWRRPLRLNAVELAAISAWPVGLTAELPVASVGSRLMPPSRAIPRKGRRLGEARFPGRERPVALSPAASLRHLHVLGPTGVGKSTLLLNLIAQDIAAGRAVVVVEPKGDLIADVLERIPASRISDVVLLDPTDAERSVGINPLALGSRSPELAADQLLGLFHSLHAANWGPRTHDILGASLLTLARTPGMTLAAVPLLLTNAGFRRRIVSPVADPIGLAPFWSTYESWSEQERATAIGPVMNKLRPLLLRPEMRAVIGQARPRFELHQVFTERKILLVDLSKGLLGPEASALLGSLVVAQLWNAILGRATVPPARRQPAFVFVDEFQDYLHLPLDFADALAQSRGLGVGWTVAHQYLQQLSTSMRSAVLANAQSRVAFRLPAEDARLVASGSALQPEDFQELGAFQGYAQLVAGGAVQTWCSLATLPAPHTSSDPAAVRAASRAAYGVASAEVEADLRRLLTTEQRSVGVADDLSPRKRDARGSA